MRQLLLFLFACALVACARQGAPTGGPKDTTPPVLDSLRSTPNYQTRFKQHLIELRFDEWVQLKDATQQVVVSPPLPKNPKVTLHGKTVEVDLGENVALRPNTTYTINFGTAVQDFHEGNPAKDLRFVFATGDVLDSLEVRGFVKDALTDEPVENITVMLYDDPQGADVDSLRPPFKDSTIVREKPYYFARTDKSGQFSIRNVRAAQFRCVAIDEGQTPDLTWDEQNNERLGFLAQPIVTSDSAKQVTVTLLIAKNQPRLRLSDRASNRYGLVRLGYTTTPPDSLPLRPLDDAPAGLRLLTERSQDSVLVWYDYTPNPDTTLAKTEKPTWRLVAGERDTVVVKGFVRGDFLAKNRLRLADDAPPPSTGKKPRTTVDPGLGAAPTAIGPPVKTLTQNPSRPTTLNFTAPLVNVDTARWLMTEDSLPFRNFTVRPDSLSPRALNFSAQWRPGKNYTLQLLPGAVSDFWGKTNPDTLRRNFNVLTDKQLGTINLTVSVLKPGVPYVLQILNGSTVEAERRWVAAGTEQRLLFPNFSVGTYNLRLVEDQNSNGQWDPGSYFDHRQPEAIFNKKLDPLRPNWELEATLEAVSGADRKKLKGKQ